MHLPFGLSDNCVTLKWMLGFLQAESSGPMTGPAQDRCSGRWEQAEESMSEHCAFLLIGKGDGGEREGEGWEKERERRLKREHFLRWLEEPGRETKRRKEPRGWCLSLTLAWGRQEGTHKKTTVGEIFQNPSSEIADGNMKIG